MKIDRFRVSFTITAQNKFVLIKIQFIGVSKGKCLRVKYARALITAATTLFWAQKGIYS